MKSNSTVQRLKESALIISVLSGSLVACLYAAEVVPPTVLGGNLIYLPAFIAAFLSSLFYEGNQESWRIGLISASVSVLPLFVAVTEIYMDVGINSELLGAVILSIISAMLIGIVGSYAHSYIDYHFLSTHN